MINNENFLWKKIKLQHILLLAASILCLAPFFLSFFPIWETQKDGKINLFLLAFNSLTGKGLFHGPPLEFFLFLIFVGIAVKYVVILIFLFKKFPFSKEKILKHMSLEDYSLELSGITGTISFSAKSYLFTILCAIIFSFTSLGSENPISLLPYIKPIKALFYVGAAQIVIAVISLLFVNIKRIDKRSILYNVYLILLAYVIIKSVLSSEFYAFFIPALESSPKNFPLVLFGAPNTNAVFYVNSSYTISTSMTSISIVSFIPLGIILFLVKDLCFRISYILEDCVIDEEELNNKFNVGQLNIFCCLGLALSYFLCNYALAEQPEVSVSIAISSSFILYILFFCAFFFYYYFSSKKQRDLRKSKKTPPCETNETYNN